MSVSETCRLFHQIFSTEASNSVAVVIESQIQKKNLYLAESELITFPDVFHTYTYRSSRLEGFLGKGVLKICSKFTGEHQCQSAIWHGCSPVNLLHISRRPFSRSTSGWLLLMLIELFSGLKYPFLLSKIYFYRKTFFI